jgi:hypothetical protein
MHIKAGYLNGYPIRCSVCLETKEAGRVYDIDDVTIFDAYGAPSAHGPVSICEDCRKDFHYADMELDAPDMERRARQRDEEDADEQRRTAWTRAVTHATFPPDME